MTGVVAERDIAKKYPNCHFIFIRNWSKTSAISLLEVYLFYRVFLQCRSTYTSSVELESFIFSLCILLLDCLSYMNSRENVTLTLNVIYSK